MHESTNQMAAAACEVVRSGAEAVRMEPGEATSGDMPGPTERATGATYGSDAISIHRHKCKKCGGEMRKGQAIAQTMSGTPDFPGDRHAVTVSPGGPGRLIDYTKCANCGWSVTGVPQSRAADRARLKELASNYGAKCRVNGVGNEVCNAWRALTDAIDNLVVDEC